MGGFCALEEGKLEGECSIQSSNSPWVSAMTASLIAIDSLPPTGKAALGYLRFGPQVRESGAHRGFCPGDDRRFTAVRWESAD